MSILNRLAGGMATGLLYPFRGLPSIVGIAVMALLTSVGILLVYRVASDQAALKTVKARITAGVLEIRLFRDDLRAILRAQLDILRHTLTYLRLSVVPMLWVIVPVILLLIQLQFRYGYERLRVGDTAIVKVLLEEGTTPEPLDPGIVLSVPEGVVVATPLLLIPSKREVDWRISIVEPGEYELVVECGGTQLTKTLLASVGTAQLSPRRPSSRLLDRLLYPAESPVQAESPIEAIEVTYQDASVSFFGWRTHWMVAFFVLTLVFAFALQRPLRVTI